MEFTIYVRILRIVAESVNFIEIIFDFFHPDHGAVLTQDTEQFIIGQKVWVGGIRPGQIAYIGETHFAPGDWAGIVLDEPNGMMAKIDKCNNK